MRIRNIVIAACILGITATVSAQRAVWRKEANKHHVDVTVPAQAIADDPVVAAIFSVDKDGIRKRVVKFSEKLAAGSSKFSIELPGAPEPTASSYVVSVFEFPTAGGVLSYDLVVGRLVTAKLLSQDLTCRNGIQLELKSAEFTSENWQEVIDWAHEPGSEFVTVTITVAEESSKFPLDRVRVLTKPALAVADERMFICVELRPTLPARNFDATVALIDPPYDDLKKPISGKGLKGDVIPTTPTSKDDNGLPGNRGLERNLDLGVSFTSSVGEKKADDGSTFIGRTSRGTFDIRFAPLLKFRPNSGFDANDRWLKYFTPFYLDAAVSTGKIEKETLSMNRVILGTEYEWRYYDIRKHPNGDPKLDAYVTYHRFILRGNHASDRDFKQKEFFGTFEYQPVIGVLNHPLTHAWTVKDGVRHPNDMGFGYQIIPRFGFTIGKTYHRDDPAPAIKPSATIRRAHVGLDMNFNFTKYVQLSITDTMFFRGEAEDDRFHNYFKGTIEAPLGSPFAKTVNSLFLSFERGQQPPFASRDVNVFKVGYRIRSAGWWARNR